jgi:hypothetical protein
MVAPPRLHQQLGAKWVEVTKAVCLLVLCMMIDGARDFENAASNTRYSPRFRLLINERNWAQIEELLPS